MLQTRYVKISKKKASWFYKSLTSFTRVGEQNESGNLMRGKGEGRGDSDDIINDSSLSQKI